MKLEITWLHGIGLCKRLLNQVIEGAPPAVQNHANLHVEIGQEQDHGRHQNRPVLPGVRAEDRPKSVEKADDDDKIDVEPQERLGPEIG
jgi:hypothetical protein